jgi:hypothetical protein
MRTAPLPRLLPLLLALAVPASAAAPSPWPEVTRENKPWTRWWWPGSAVDRASLTAQLEKLAAAGIGGVEITPIYGAKGAEPRYLRFLSPEWMAMLEHTGREARRLGLGVDMATGTGWPFGGPWIDQAHALQRAVLRDGRLTGEPGRMMVKRAAPGGEGLVVDPFSTEALARYLEPFERAFAGFPRDLVRGQFHDSFEYFNASWTTRLPEAFRTMHGYDLQRFAAELAARHPADVTTIDRDTLARVKADYRETLGRLHLDYLRAWVAWSRRQGWIVRNQSHGAPANLLDLYGAVDVPETEIFGSTPFPAPGLRREADEVRHDQDLPEPLVVRMASSAAHVMGRPLASSESATWLREHWKESLAYVKPELDRILAEGINHIFYHGTVFSPQDAPWPGWLFYASTQFNPNNTWWRDFAELNRYVARVQSVLQRGRPDNDVLLYWPAADIWDNADGLARMLTVHHVGWLTEEPVGRLARKLGARGHAFDYISDDQLAATRAEDGVLVTPGSRHAVLVVPAARRMPVATLQRIAELAKAGARVIFEQLPEDVPGYGRLAERRAQFQAALAAAKSAGVTVAAEVTAALAPHARREAFAEAGLNFVRRATAEGHDYFVVNLTARPHRGWTPIAGAGSLRVMNPLDGRTGLAPARGAAGGSREFLLHLEPGESLILRATRVAAPEEKPWPVHDPAGPALALNGTWKVEFAEGGPELPAAFTTNELKSWTTLGGEAAERFGGTARYTLEFEAPAVAADDWRLDLGDVRESARVSLNGRPAGTAWSVPFRLPVGALLRPGRNRLEIEVTNLAANRIRDLDRRKVDWKVMREINFVNINYKPFDAAGWPLAPSGLLGPVTLTPLRAARP